MRISTNEFARAYRNRTPGHPREMKPEIDCYPTQEVKG